MTTRYKLNYYSLNKEEIMKLSDKTKIENINNGKLKREVGMVYGSFWKSGNVYTDLTWLGLMPIEKDGEKLREIIKNQQGRIENLENKLSEVKDKLETSTHILGKVLNMMKEGE